MTIIKYGAGIAEMRGSIGSVVFGRNRAGAVARQRQRPAEQRTTAAAGAKYLLQKWSGYWRSHLNDPQRVAWNTLAAATDFTNPLGETYNLNGRNLYLRSAVLLAIASEPDQDDAPDEVLETGYVFSVAFDEYFGLAVRTVGAYSQDGEGSLIVACSGPMPPTRYAHYSPWSHLAVIAYDFDDSLPFSLVAPLDVVLDRHYFFSFRTIRTDTNVVGDDWHGKATQPFFADCSVLDWVRPVFWLPLNDNAASDVVLEQVSNDNQTFESDVAGNWTQDVTGPGPYELSLLFDGLGDHIDIDGDAFNSLLAQGSRYCFNLWIQHPAGILAGHEYFAGKNLLWNSRALWWDAYLPADDFRLSYYSDGGTFSLSCQHANQQDSSWHMYTIQRSSTDVELYIDGAVQAADHSAGWDSVMTSANPFRLGAIGLQFGAAPLADFRAYDDSLTPAQILALYNATP